MSTHESMTPERLAAARAALDEDHSLWGGEYGLDLVREVERLQRFESIVSWRYGDTTDGSTREDMAEKAAEVLFLREFLRENDWADEARARVSLAVVRDMGRAWQIKVQDARAALEAALGTQKDA